MERVMPLAEGPAVSCPVLPLILSMQEVIAKFLYLPASSEITLFGIM